MYVKQRIHLFSDSYINRENEIFSSTLLFSYVINSLSGSTKQAKGCKLKEK